MILACGTLVSVLSDTAHVQVPPARILRIPIGPARAAELRGRAGYGIRLEIADPPPTPSDYDEDLWVAINHHTALLTRPECCAAMADIKAAKRRIDAAVEAIRRQAQNEVLHGLR